MTKFQRWGSMAAAVLSAVVALVPSLEADDGLHKVWAVKDCRVVLPSGPALEKATIVIRDGLIEAVGKGVAVPPDAEIIDGSKLTAYPGLVDGLGKALLKLPEEKLDMTKFYTGDFTDKDKGITPEFKAYDHVSLGKAALEKYYKYGFTAAQVMHDRGILSGRSAFFMPERPGQGQGPGPDGGLHGDRLQPLRHHGLPELSHGRPGLSEANVPGLGLLRHEPGPLAQGARRDPLGPITAPLSRSWRTMRRAGSP